MTVDEIRHKIDTEPDFVAVKKFDYSLQKLVERYPEGAPLRIISQALMMTEKEVEELLESVILKVRAEMRIEV